MSDIAFVGPRSRETARELIDAAVALDLDPQIVATTAGGYLVPVEIVDHIDSEKRRKEEEKEAARAAAQAAANALRAAAEKAEKEAAERAAAQKAEKEASEKEAPKPTPAPRARRSTKASDAGKEKA